MLNTQINKWTLYFKDTDYELEWRISEISNKRNIVKGTLIFMLLINMYTDIFRVINNQIHGILLIGAIVRVSLVSLFSFLCCYIYCDMDYLAQEIGDSYPQNLAKEIKE